MRSAYAREGGGGANASLRPPPGSTAARLELDAAGGHGENDPGLALTQPIAPPRRKGRLAFAGLVLVAAAFAASAAAPRNVLVLQSYERGAEPFDTIATEFRAALAAGSPSPVELHEISLATALYPGGESEEAFVRYLASFEARRPFDLVVTIGGSATRFVQRHRTRIFKSTPLLIAGADRRLLEPQALTPDDAAVATRLDLAGAFANILQLFPQTTEVVGILGRSPLEQYWVEELRREFQPFADRVRLTFWDDLPYQAILERAAELPAGTAIFYGFYVTDVDGVSHADDSALDALHSVAAAPLFGLFDHQLGRGIVGGPLIPVRGVAQEAAGAANRLLAGEEPARVRPPSVVAAAPTFDGRELDRWRIGADRLPPGSWVRFREPTLWQAHKGKILGTAAVLGLEAALIVALSVSLAGRRRAERDLRKSREQYALAVEGTTDGLWDWDVRTGVIDFTPRSRTLLGIAAGEPADRLAAWEERIHPDDRHRVQAALQAHLDGKSPAFRAEHRLGPGEGSTRWVLARGKALRDAEGRAIRLVGALTDVTERRLAEEAVRDLSRRLIVAQEDERARLARELHDDLTQRLARLAIDVGRAEQEGGGSRAEATMRLVREGLVRLSEDVHALSYRLHPSLLEDLGLAEALQVECDRFGRLSGIAVDLVLSDVPQPVSRGAALCLFRVAQEALRNVDRHARARTVEVRLQGLDGGLQLAVQDDGVGFDPAAVRGRRSLGHASMRERIHLAGGELDIESAPDQGTTVVAWVPLAEERG
ncbi:MAG: PAS domain-containing protein [Acidobacteria bacterium]|nr:PAS domain-containing protein [Acidobacteriota bacterium]